MNSFCAKCGHPIDEDTGFCPKCEKELVEEARKYLEHDGLMAEYQELDDEAPAVSVPVAPTGSVSGVLAGSVSGALAGSVPVTSAGSPNDSEQPSKRKRRAAPAIIVAVVCLVAGALMVWQFGMGKDEIEETEPVATDNSNSTEVTEETTEKNISRFSFDERSLYYEGIRDDADMIKEHNGLSVFTNQLIVAGDDSDLIGNLMRKIQSRATMSADAKGAGMETSEEAAGQETYEEDVEALLAEAEIVGINDFDQTALLRWNQKLKQKQIRAIGEELARQEGIEGVMLNYAVNDAGTEMISQDGSTWWVDEAGCIDLLDYTKRNLKSSVRIGYMGSTSEKNAVRSTLNTVLPGDAYGSLAETGFEIKSLYDVTAGLTKLIMNENNEDNCRVICFNESFGEPKNNSGWMIPVDCLSRSLVKMDAVMEQAVSQREIPNDTATRGTLICYPQGEIDDSVFTGMECINGISVGYVEQDSADGRIRKQDSVDENMVNTMAPSTALVAGFAADAMILGDSGTEYDEPYTAKKCRSDLIESANIAVEGSNICMMINGVKLKRLLAR